jgi:hypothetical protein
VIETQGSENLKTFAHVSGGKVVNVSLWLNDPEDETLIEIPKESAAGIDWDYIDGEFVDNRPKTELLEN